MKKNYEQGNSLWKDARLRLMRNRAAMASLIFLLLMVLACFVLPLFPCIANPNATNLAAIAADCSWVHPFGTDQLGRDLLARVLYGGRISLLVGLVATAVSFVIGLCYGLVSGYVGGRTDAFMMRTVDVLFALPFIVLVIVFSLSIEEPSRELTNWVVEHTGWSRESVAPILGLVPLFIAIGALGWLTLARIVRTQTLEIKSQEYVLAARSTGARAGWIIKKHLIPNCISVIIISTALQIPSAIFTESFLSFLGLGVNAPMPSLGSLASEARNGMSSYPHLLAIPAVVISLVVLSLNLFGDGLRDAFDPKLKN